MTYEDAISYLKSQGTRLSLVRVQIMHILYESDKPLTAAEVASRLHILKLAPNKSTLYRELTFLCDNSIARPLQIYPRTTSYEWSQVHHHHLVCRVCSEVQPIELEKIERLFGGVATRAKQNGFHIERHTLEFYGTCADCS